MTVKVFLKQPAPNGKQVIEFQKDAILDLPDKDIPGGRVAFCDGETIGNLKGTWEHVRTQLIFEDVDHIMYAWNCIDRIEVTP